MWREGKTATQGEGQAQQQTGPLSGLPDSFQPLTAWLSDINQTEMTKPKTTGANTGFQVLWEQRHLFK